MWELQISREETYTCIAIASLYGALTVHQALWCGSLCVASSVLGGPVGCVLLITVTKAGCNAYGAPSAIEAQRQVKLTLVFKLREGFTEEKIDLEGWVGFYR